MKVFLLFWATPIVLLGGWYGLSYYDLNFGFRILTRDLHDLVFVIYGDLLGMPPESIPPLVLKAIVFDTFLVLGFVVIKRRRKQIWSAILRVFGWDNGEARAGETESVPQGQLLKHPLTGREPRRASPTTGRVRPAG